MPKHENVNEYRRRRSIELLDRGDRIDLIARFFEVTTTTLRRWQKEDSSSVSNKSKGGRPRKLSDSQLAKLEELLLEGATRHGWFNDLWTGRRVNEMVRRHFNIEYHPLHVYRILRLMGWTRQKPTKRVSERDESRINRWKNKTIKKVEMDARIRGAYLMFIDESGFMLEPTVGHTFAPKRFYVSFLKFCKPETAMSPDVAVTL